MLLKFDEANLFRVAEIVSHFNPHATQSVAGLVAYMKQTAEQCLANHPRPTYCGTMGFMLTSFLPDYDKKHYHIKASIDPCCFHGIAL